MGYKTDYHLNQYTVDSVDSNVLSKTAATCVPLHGYAFLGQ